MKKQSILAIIIFQILLLLSHQAETSNSEVYFHIKLTSDLKYNIDLPDFNSEYLNESSNVSIMNLDGYFDRSIGRQSVIETWQVVLYVFYNQNQDLYDFVVFLTTFLVDSGEFKFE